VCLIGANGAGKTTTLNAIAGVLPTVGGEIRYLGEPVQQLPAHKRLRRGIALVPEGRRIFPSLTVDENLRVAEDQHRRHPRRARRWTRARVYELFPDLVAAARRGGHQISGGQQQMLAIGRALVTNPKLLIMDEPSEGLAPTIIEMLIDTFGKLEEEGLRILLIEQNLGMATAIAERQLVMVGGEIAAETTAQELGSSAELQRRYLGVEPVAH
jgi:branched-chain amino acid transport system ATP-binding protein